jgi:mannosylglycoprotein endo-beta-mannosidase
MMFILALEPLQCLLQSASSSGLLSPINSRSASLRASLYADDVAVFLKPIKEDVQVVAYILDVFGHASGLITNRAKCVVYPIQCDGIDVAGVMEDFQCPIQAFPCKYLGLPLHYKHLWRVDVQPLIDKIGNRLPTWRGRFFNRAGRLKLLNSVLSSIPTYFLTVFAPATWMLKKVDKIRRGFLWKGTESATGGSCLVRWANVLKPKEYGGLGVLDLEWFSRALRICWMWFQWSDPNRPWIGSEIPCSEVDMQFFRASTRVAIGNGRAALFWQSSWLSGAAPRDLVPSLYKLARRKNDTVVVDLANGNWLRGLWRMSTAVEIAEFISLWGLV